MTLPIMESILWGALRPNLIDISAPQKEMSRLSRLLRHAQERTSLIDMEREMVAAVGNLCNIKEVYHGDNEIKRAAASLDSDKDVAYHVVYMALLRGFLCTPSLSTPVLRFYSLLLELEMRRTLKYLVDFHSVMRDDAFLRTEAKEVLHIIELRGKEVGRLGCSEDLACLLRTRLTELYFSIVTTFAPILYVGEVAEDFEDDLESFVYAWRGEFPSEEEMEEYGKQVNLKRKEVGTIEEIPDSSVKVEADRKPRTKAEKFLEGASEYNFLSMPKIVALDSDEARRHEKALRLVEMMLVDLESAATMLEFLGFYDWIKAQYKTRYPKTEYDRFCSKLILGRENSQFGKCRKAVTSPSEKMAKYRKNNYRERVEEDYAAIKNS